MSHPAVDTEQAEALRLGFDCSACRGTGRVASENPAEGGRGARCLTCDGSGKAPRFAPRERHALLRLVVGWELGSSVHGSAGDLTEHPIDCSGCRAAELRALLLPALPEPEKKS